MSSTAPPTGHDTQARYQTLLDVTESISAHRQLSTLFADLSRCLNRLVSFEFIGLTLLDPKDQTFHLHILHSDRPTIGNTLSPRPYSDSPTGLALSSRRPYYVPDVDHEEGFPSVLDMLRANGIRSFCILPLFTAQRDLGGLLIGAQHSHAYSDRDIEFMQQVARQVAVAVDNTLNAESSRAYEEQLSRERDRLRALLEINNAVVGCLETQPLFQAISSGLRRTFGIDYASLLIYDPEIQALRLHALDFPESTGVIQPNAVVALEGTLGGYIFETREGRIFSIEEAREISPSTAEIFSQERLECICCAPLIAHGKALGTLNLGSRRRDFFSAGDLQFFTQAAWQIALALDNAFSYQRIEVLNARLEDEKVYLEDEIRTDNVFADIIGESPALKHILKQVETVAPTDSTVLIYGETGTGKELVARAIHDLSSRKQGTFVKLNCAAIPTGLLESEMFGHEKGAFTGAIAQRIGRFELANHGTMFLDEIGEIPLELQTKLLRVLQEREFERLGSSKTIRTDARLVAATNRDLTEMVEKHEFRADLYYRVNVFPITVPSLRERREDIPLLVRYFVQHYGRRMNKRIRTIPSETLQVLTRYDWPGNIRELQNFIERAVILSPGPTLQAPIRELKRAPGSSGAVQTLVAAEREAIVRALRDSGGKVGGVSGAAAKLGMKRTTLQAKMRKLGLDRQVS
jgi:formate hydrogenlyase transcriptional activator